MNTERLNVKIIEVWYCGPWLILELSETMAGFTENALVRKLQELNSSQQSIQTLSLWLIHHRKHHAIVVKTWFKEILKGNLQY